MAAALPKFSVKIFSTPLDLKNYVTNSSSDVVSVVSITTDNAGKWVLFYIST